ncbi:MAG TPA: hypothetical protein PKE04_19275 [Clostridia bacterium]|nr:hypothetical protein [Clostridia bacterium]
MYGNRSLDTFDEFVDTLYNTFGQQQYDDLLNENLKSAGIIQ